MYPCNGRNQVVPKDERNICHFSYFFPNVDYQNLTRKQQENYRIRVAIMKQ